MMVMLPTKFSIVFLGTQGQGNTANTQRRQPSGHVPTEDVEDGDDTEGNKQKLDAATKEQHGRKATRLPALDQSSFGVAGKYIDKLPQQ